MLNIDHTELSLHEELVLHKIIDNIGTEEANQLVQYWHKQNSTRHVQTNTPGQLE